jgi:hypothetical protein
MTKILPAPRGVPATSTKARVRDDPTRDPEAWRAGNVFSPACILPQRAGLRVGVGVHGSCWLGRRRKEESEGGRGEGSRGGLVVEIKKERGSREECFEVTALWLFSAVLGGGALRFPLGRPEVIGLG